MKLLLTVLFVISFNGQAYPPKVLDMTEHEYRRYVRPQFKSILQDYETLLLLLNPELKPLKKSFSDIKTLIRMQIKLKDNCMDSQIKSCLMKLKEIENVLSSLKENSQSKIDLNHKEYLTIDEKLKAQRFFSNYKARLIKAQTSIENQVLNVTLVQPKILSLRILKDDLDKVITSFYLFTTEASDNRFKNDINAYCINVVIPVYKFILVQDQKEYFFNNINELNIRWNALHVRLSKRGKIVSKQVKTLTNIMHNRWNRILKVSINPMKY